MIRFGSKAVVEALVRVACISALAAFLEATKGFTIESGHEDCLVLLSTEGRENEERESECGRGREGEGGRGKEGEAER